MLVLQVSFRLISYPPYDFIFSPTLPSIQASDRNTIS
jgi:hypothetical protein